MPHTPLTISMITQEALDVLKNNLVMGKLVNRGFDEKYAQVGAKIGDTLSVRLPPRYTVGFGATMVPQDFTETSTQVVLNKQAHIGLSFTSKELLLDIDAFSERVLAPAVSQLANQMDSDVLGLYKQVPRFVGVPATVPADLDVYLNAKAALANAGAPIDDKLAVVINPTMEAKIAYALKDRFHSASQVSMAFEKGKITDAAGFKWYMDQNCPSHAVGALGASNPTVKAAPAAGATTLSTQAWAAGGILNEGDIITIADCYEVNPQNRQSTGEPQKFTVTSLCTADGAGDMAVTVSPAITATGAFQTVDSVPVIGKAISVFGKGTADFGTIAGVTHREGLAFHRDALVLACADLPLNDAAKGSRVSDTDFGLSLRVMRDYDIMHDLNIWRLDVLYGVRCVRPELAVRILS
ncbi:MAG: hypothetical protein LLG20_18480 [Acidobacteriales bacterium]|nr:hypothetical protein [Terriglobales bacterium]